MDQAAGGQRETPGLAARGSRKKGRRHLVQRVPPALAVESTGTSPAAEASAAELLGLVVDVHGHGLEAVLVLLAVVGAEEEFAA